MALVGFDIYSILLLLLSQKYAIEYKKTTSQFWPDPHKRICPLAKAARQGQRDDTLHFYANNAIYIALLCI